LFILPLTAASKGSQYIIDFKEIRLGDTPTMQTNASTGSSRRMANNAASAGNSSNALGATGATASSVLAANSQARMGQLLDDQDHQRCSEGNHRALLAENLDQLRGLVKVLETDDWKYSSVASKQQTPIFPPDSEFSTSVPQW
jgi:hypothetical protein